MFAFFKRSFSVLTFSVFWASKAAVTLIWFAQIVSQQISPSATEKRLELDLLSIKENIEQLGLQITWIDTKLQIADPLTKRMDTMSMMIVLMKGIYVRICEFGYTAGEKLTSAQHHLLMRDSLAPPDAFDIYG